MANMELYFMTKSNMITIGILSTVAVLIVAIFIGTYNNVVNKEEQVTSAFAQIESNIQRKADLIPGLIKTVKAYTKHEQEVFIKTTEARSGKTDINDLIKKLEESQAKTKELAKGAKNKLNDEEYMGKLALMQKKMGQNVTQLFAVAENYPQLRASDNFLSLQSQLEGTENRINVARMSFNNTAKDYNATIRKLPGVIIASMLGFQRKAYFEAKEEAKEVEVNF